MRTQVLKLVLAAFVCFGAAGCAHKTVTPLVIPAPTPVVVASPAVPGSPAQLPTETAGQPPLPTAKEVPAVPAKKVKKKVVPAPAAPVEVASAAPPPPPVEIGSLTAEGDQTAGNRKTAVDLLAANDKRLAGLPVAVKNKEKDQVTRVQSFQGDARRALNGGDGDAAMTLATKAKVLLDELAK